MYVPAPFAMNDRQEQLAFIRANPFGVLVSAANAAIQATHVPFVILGTEEEPRLGLHVARANPQWNSIDGQDVLCIYTGEHAFVSASWYGDPVHSVPTWDYTAVHVRGRATLANERTREQILRALTAENEPKGGWSMEQADPAYLDANRKAIVAIEIAIHKIEGAKKLSQNRTAGDREGVARGLEAHAEVLAAQIRAHGQTTK
jgi:transcriptional regulator